MHHSSSKKGLGSPRSKGRGGGGGAGNTSGGGCSSVRRRPVVTSRRYSRSRSRGPGGSKGGKGGGATFIATPKAILSALDTNIGANLVAATHTASGGGVVDAATQRGNIKVVVRVRPANNREVGPSRRLIVQAIDSHLVVFDPKEDDMGFYFHGKKQKTCKMLKKPHKDLKFVFDNVYGPNDSNHLIFEGTIKPTIDTLLAGFNCSVFAYGATGSGKTYTMLGVSGSQNPGLTFLTVMELYNRLQGLEHEYESEVAISYLEVYNETIKDLLASSTETLNVCEESSGVVVIPKLTKHKPENAEAILDLLKRGNSVRSQHPTDHNAESSRSHAVFQVFVTLRGRYKDLNNNVKGAKLVMVDLAGSERGSATGFQGARFREGASINKSLLALGNCINALADGKNHIPYRDSKLTRILKDALGGNCKTVMIANVSPSDLSYDDTHNTLKYADRAKRIKFNVKKNLMTVHARVAQYGQVVSEMAKEIEYYKKKVEDYERTCKCNSSKIDASTETDEEYHVNVNDYNTPYSPSDSPTSIYNTMNTNHNNTTIVLGNYGGGGSGDTTICVSNGNRNTITSRRSPSPYSQICSSYEAKKLESYRRFARLLKEKTSYESRLSELLTHLRDTDWKLKWKRERLEAAKLLYNNDVCTAKGIQKMKKQYDALESRKKDLKRDLLNLQDRLDETRRQLSMAEDCFTSNESSLSPSMVTISRAEFIQLQKLLAAIPNQSTFQTQFQTSFASIFDELLRTEDMLDRCLLQFKPTHLLMKHHGHTTEKNDKLFWELMTDFYHGRIQFAVGKNDEPSVALSPYYDNDIYNNGPASNTMLSSTTTTYYSCNSNGDEDSPRSLLSDTDVISSTSMD